MSAGGRADPAAGGRPGHTELVATGNSVATVVTAGQDLLPAATLGGRRVVAELVATFAAEHRVAAS